MDAVRTEQELAVAANRGESTIVIEGDLARKVVRIKATGKVAWLIAVAAIAIAVAALLAAPATAGIAAAPALPLAGAAVAILGASATTAAIRIAHAAGGAKVLETLRQSYDMVDQSDGRVVLRRH